MPPGFFVFFIPPTRRRETVHRYFVFRDGPTLNPSTSAGNAMAHTRATPGGNGTSSTKQKTFFEITGQRGGISARSH